MKKIILILLIPLFISCYKPPRPEELPAENKFVGTVSVDYEEGTHHNPDITVACLPSADGRSADIVIYKIKFVPKMPVRIDVTIPGVTITRGAEGAVLLSCDNVIPLALGGEYPKYNVTKLEGKLGDGELQFSLNFGAYPTRFSGVSIR